MSKRTIMALFAFVAILGGSYYLFSRANGKAGGVVAHRPDEDAEFDGEDLTAGSADAALDLLDEGTTKGLPIAGDSIARGPGSPLPGVETIDDPDENGETVKDRVVIDDPEEGGVSLDDATKGIATPPTAEPPTQ